MAYKLVNEGNSLIVRKAFTYFLYGLVILIALTTLLSLFYNLRFWWLKVLDFPRLQLFIVGLLLLPLVLFIPEKRKGWYISSVVLLGLTLVIQGYYIYPYTSLGDKKVPTAIAGSETFSLMISNVYMKNEEYNRLLDQVEQSDPDILIILEPDTVWQQQMAPLRNQYAYQMEYPLGNTYGMFVYSKFPLKNSEWLFLNKDDVPCLRTQLSLPNQQSFILYAVHPVPPIPDEYPDNVGEKEVALKKIGNQLDSINLPVLIAGDYNDVSWSKTSMLFEEEGEVNNVRLGRGLYNSFNANSNIFRWPLDHIFVTEGFGLKELKRLPDIGSDHFPIYAELSLQ